MQDIVQVAIKTVDDQKLTFVLGKEYKFLAWRNPGKIVGFSLQPILGEGNGVLAVSFENGDIISYDGELIYILTGKQKDIEKSDQ